MNDVNYPQNPEQWRIWVHKKLGISEEEGICLLERGNFPLSNLVKAWERDFSAANGFSLNFIPALTRNRNGFVRWVYGNGPEPNWTKSDE
jgi:hypothetical protein